MGTTPIHLYQIAYSQATLSEIEPGYEVLDNLANPRPDWYEYWPIRQFLFNRALDESAFYGFFSPKFKGKTGLSYQQVIDFIQTRHEKTDVFLFSPQPDMGAFFLSVFEQGETYDAGFTQTYEAVLRQVGWNLNLQSLVMDSRQIVYSNYFVARPQFWREWLQLNEVLFAVCEGPDNALKQACTQSTSYPGAVQRKVFLMERTASLLLTLNPRWRTAAANPFQMAWSDSGLRHYPREAFISDALKLAWRENGWGEYLQAFKETRENLFQGRGTT